MVFARCVVVLALLGVLPAWGGEGVAAWPVNLAGEDRVAVQVPVADCKATVLVFTTPGCPIANRYAPVLAEIAREFGGSARFFRVYADPEVGVAEAAAHEQAYHYGFPALFDPSQEAVSRCGATRTPEIAVLDAAGALRYRGAVDDQYADFGTYRRTVTHHYLRDALTAVIEGKDVVTPRTAALGCFIPEPETQPAPPEKQ